MTLVRRRTPTNLEVAKGNLFGDFDRFFSDFLTPFVQAAGETVGNYPANLYETDNNFVLELAVPGVSKDDVDISIEGRHLTVKGSYKDESENSDEKRHYHVSTFQKGEFTRTITLPNQVDADNIKANIKDGVLNLNIPKVEAARAKKININ